MKGRRVFVGLPVCEALIETVDTFRRKHDDLKVRWTRPENLHLTMVPPWQCSTVEAACRALGAVSSDQAPFHVAFDLVSFGPDRRCPRLVWATGSAPSGMAEYAGKLVMATVMPGESRKRFLLHLTIARFNSHDFKVMGTRLLHEPVAWACMFDTLCLYESILKPAGAEYRELCRFGLTGDGLACDR
ncbi:MAG: RNA 2',3'-cyclic phosphodiesterase [Chlorobiaceae bacterium]|nr:RNA 2',3'-cyclic phosphodiesterase [Chlorobiaceae bacterium]